MALFHYELTWFCLLKKKKKAVRNHEGILRNLLCVECRHHLFIHSLIPCSMSQALGKHSDTKRSPVPQEREYIAMLCDECFVGTRTAEATPGWSFKEKIGIR